jgi:hypothetical protein
MVAAFLIGIPDSFTAFRELVAWVSPFGMQSIHVAFWLLGVGAIYTTIIQGIRIRQLEGRLPKITAVPKVYKNQAFLEVHNSGASGLFQATGRVIATNIAPQPYVMYWEGTGSNSPIDKYGYGAIKVAERAKQTVMLNRDADTAIYGDDLVGFKMGTSGEQIFPIRTFVEHAEGDKIIGEIEDKGVVEITVTSNPPLAKPTQRSYLLEFDDSRNLRFIELPTPIKEGSQT